MSNPNPFVPKGSLLEQQSKRRSNLKIGVSCVLAVGIIGLLAMLIQGCKRDTSSDNTPPSDQETNQTASAADTNTPPPIDTNTPPVEASASNLPPSTPAPAPLPIPAPAPAPTPVENPAPAEGGGEYVVVAGDTLGKIAHRNGISLKALEAANPDVNPRRLKVNQKLVIPAGGSAPAGVAEATPDEGASDTGSAKTYTVKSGDTLHRIAKRFHTSVKSIEDANDLSTTKIKVGQKLKIPVKEASAAPEAAPAPAAPTEAPALPPATTPAAPAPGAAPAPAPGAPGAT